MKIENLNILLISPESWGQNFVSKHHYAAYLSKSNKVFFLNPSSPAKIKPGLDLRIEKKNQNLWIIHYKNLLPKTNALPKVIQRILYQKQAKSIHSLLKIESFDIIWSFDPYRFWNLKWFNSRYRIYHTVDVHFRKCYENDISASADLVLISSELLRPKLESSNSCIHYIGHGADIETFVKNHPSLQLEHTYSCTAGLVGNFNNNVDYELIKEMVQRNPKIQFYFIGPYSSNNLGNDDMNVQEKVKEIEAMDNVVFTGSVPSADIMSWLLLFDINLVLYREDKRNIIINPHKMMGYFYSGNIALCSWFSEYENADESLLVMTKNNSEIPEKLKEISENLDFYNQPEWKKARREFARKNCYENKIESIGHLLRKNA